ncbi:MAG: hypothetical protein EBY53_02400, partial [Rhodobacteraceae bacterium]|nr:hypothetical protein [Paracoccaceae bacterium]
MMQSVVFSYLIPFPLLLILIATAIAVGIYARYLGLRGWPFRMLAAGFVLLALSNPSLRIEERQGLSDIVLIVVDETSSHGLAKRASQTDLILNQLQERVANKDRVVEILRVKDGQKNSGTLILSEIRQALSDIPANRLGGVFIISDGQAHEDFVGLPIDVPVHHIVIGEKRTFDRKLSVLNAPAFGIIGESVPMVLRVDDLDNERNTQNQSALVYARVGSGRVIEFWIDPLDGELTEQNNRSVVVVNGVRDRLRVLLVSGAPHPGGRVWRNLLKSDSSVDLVHFTILRPPAKQDGVPVSELSLIAFPTRELFMEKIDDFDLIIFDRYKRRGILPRSYLENIARYVRDGGAILVAAGPDFASANSIYRSPLQDVLPAAPTARVIEERYVPKVTDLGDRHPVTRGLPQQENWGAWLRQIEVIPDRGQTLMSGVDERALLTLDRVGAGRVALLASDHAWLWYRGYEAGGPQQELLKRLAHWLMKEPELEEESVTISVEGEQVDIRQYSLSETLEPAEIRTPDGAISTIIMAPSGPGEFTGTFVSPEQGIFEIRSNGVQRVFAKGAANPIEFFDPRPSVDVFAPLVSATKGGQIWALDGLPSIREIRRGRIAAGRNWMGIVKNNAYATLGVRQSPLFPPWLYLLLALGSAVLGWLREGR